MRFRRHRRLRAAVTTACAGVLLTATVAGPTASAAEQPGDRGGAAYTLTVLFTNDNQSQLLGVDGSPAPDGPIPDGGAHPYGSASRVATLLDQLRAEATTAKPRPGQAGRRGVITLSGGDNYLAGPEFTASLEKGVPYYDATAMRLIGYDASVIGNHEFDFGPDVFADFVESFGGSLPFVSANLDFSAEPELAAYVEDNTITDSVILRSRGERIGVIGLTTPQLPAISSPRRVRVLGNLAEITNRAAAGLRQHGVDKIILLSHLQDIDNELALVPELSGVDAVVGAGGGEILADPGDRLIPGDSAERGFPLWAKDSDGDRVPVVTTQGEYKYIGRLVLNFDRAGELIDIDKKRSQPVRVSGVGPDAVRGDPEVRAKVEKPVAEYLDSLAEDVVATSEVPLNGVEKAVRSRETNLGDLVADSLVWMGRQQAQEYGVEPPQVGIQNGGGIRNNSVLPAGEITALDTFGIAPFPNYVVVVPNVPRETLKALLERGVAAQPDAAGQFMQVSGLRFTFDATRQAQVVAEGTSNVVTPGKRVRNVVLEDGTVIVEDGKVIPGPPVSIATNDFSARGGDGYPFGGLPFTPVGKTYQQALQGYLEQSLNGQVTAAAYPQGGAGRIVRIG